MTRFIFIKTERPENLNLDKAYAVPRTKIVEIIVVKTATINVLQNHVVNKPSYACVDASGFVTPVKLLNK